MVGIPEKWDPGPATPTGGTLRPGTPECLGGTREAGPETWDPKIFKWDPESPKWNPGP